MGQNQNLPVISNGQKAKAWDWLKHLALTLKIPEAAAALIAWETERRDRSIQQAERLAEIATNNTLANQNTQALPPPGCGMIRLNDLIAALQAAAATHGNLECNIECRCAGETPGSMQSIYGSVLPTFTRTIDLPYEDSLEIEFRGSHHIW